MMIEKIATHLADFSPRLQSNTRALYQVRNVSIFLLFVLHMFETKLADACSGSCIKHFVPDILTPFRINNRISLHCFVGERPLY